MASEGLWFEYHKRRSAILREWAPTRWSPERWEAASDEIAFCVRVAMDDLRRMVREQAPHQEGWYLIPV